MCVCVWCVIVCVEFVVCVCGDCSLPVFFLCLLSARTHLMFTNIDNV